MKSLNEKFTDREFSKMRRAKFISGKNNWHDFIVYIAELSEEENQKEVRR